MNEPITCAKCKGTQLIIQKRGYDFKDGLTSFIVACAVLALIWILAISFEKTNNQIDSDVYKKTNMYELTGKEPPVPTEYEKNPFYLGATVIIILLSFTSGLKGANDNQRVCVACGDVKFIN